METGPVSLTGVAFVVEAVGSGAPATRPDRSTGGSFRLLRHCLPGPYMYLYIGYLYVCLDPPEFEGLL